MLKQINEFERFVSESLMLNKLTAYLALYLLILVWFKTYVFALYAVYGAVFTTISLLTLPLLFIIIHYRKHIKQNKENQKTSNVIRQLSDQQLFILRKNITTAQLNLLNEVLLISLGLLYDMLSSIPSKVNPHQTLFEDKYQAIICLFKIINRRSEFVNCTVSARSQNNAIVCFVYYRILFSGILDAAKDKKILSDDIDPWILLKRIPPGISQHLGAQGWRLYELKTLLFDDLNLLEVNEDIKSILIELCTNGISGSHEINMPNILVDAEQQNLNDSSCEVIDRKNDNEEIISDVNNPKKKLDEASLAQGSNEKPIEANHESNDKISSSLINKIQKWLPRQIKRHPINQGNYFYMDADAYCQETLFLSEVALSDFSKKSQAPLDELKQALADSHLGEGKVYTLQGDQNHKLFAMKITFSVEVIEKIPNMIMEVKV